MMDWMRETSARFVSQFRKPAMDSDLERELANHVELLTADNVQRGLSPDQEPLCFLRNARKRAGASAPPSDAEAHGLRREATWAVDVCEATGDPKEALGAAARARQGGCTAGSEDGARRWRAPGEVAPYPASPRGPRQRDHVN